MYLEDEIKIWKYDNTGKRQDAMNMLGLVPWASHAVYLTKMK